MMRKNTKVNWLTRRGTVTHVRQFSGEVEVQWDERSACAQGRQGCVM
jgi:hypothetical protein